MCLHTAGSDGRQWRHLINDAAFTATYRIIALDLPRHGKSDPPEDWAGSEYRFTTRMYTDTIRAFCGALELSRWWTCSAARVWPSRWGNG